MCVCGLNKNHCFVDCLKLSIINLQNPAPGRCFTLVTALISSHLELLRSLRITKNHLHYNHSYVCVFIYIRELQKIHQPTWSVGVNWWSIVWKGCVWKWWYTVYLSNSNWKNGQYPDSSIKFAGFPLFVQTNPSKHLQSTEVSINKLGY
jgi:hypothetical protein